jgi:hypothetical protein
MPPLVNHHVNLLDDDHDPLDTISTPLKPAVSAAQPRRSARQHNTTEKVGGKRKRAASTSTIENVAPDTQQRVAKKEKLDAKVAVRLPLLVTLDVITDNVTPICRLPLPTMSARTPPSTPDLFGSIIINTCLPLSSHPLARC